MKRDPLALVAVLLAAVAFAGSFSHVQEQVASHGQTNWLSYAIAAMPEISVILAVLRIRRSLAAGQRDLWAWVVGASAAAFTLAANLAQSEWTVWGWIVGGWPAWTAIGSAFLIKMAPDLTGQSKVKPQVKAPKAPAAKPVPAAKHHPDRPVTGQVSDPVSGQVKARSLTSVPGGSGQVTDPLLDVARQVKADLPTGHRLTRADLLTGLKAAGHSVGTDRARRILAQLEQETAA